MKDSQREIAVFPLTMHQYNPRAEQTETDRVYPGDGILDLGQMISILKDADYTGVISLELFNPSYWEQDPAEIARIGLEKMQALLDNEK